jgi:phosphatidylglycerophosphate synthase
MTPAIHHTQSGTVGRLRPLAEVAAGLVPLLVVAGVTARVLGLPPTYLLRAMALYFLGTTIVVRFLPTRRPSPGLGPANHVTLGRATLVMTIAALVPESRVLTDNGYWWIIAVSTLALCLDGVDGWVARRTGTATAFGARFDMELDTVLMLILTTLVWRSGRVGPWVLLLGLPRYLFVAAGWRWRWLRAPLPERLRRKAGCVLQGIALLVCLGPIVPPSLASVAAALTVVLLYSSFAVDISWLKALAAETSTPVGSEKHIPRA